jgi:glucose-6-phosphate 1-dehydrogenase
VPVIGVAKSGWNLEQFKVRAHDSLEKYGGVDPAAFEKLCGLLRYIDGDYEDPETFKALDRELGGAMRPAYYLAIPPLLFGSVIEHLTNLGGTQGRRVIVEKPFGHDLESARELNRILHGCFAEENIFRIDHYLGKRAINNLMVFRFANTFVEWVAATFEKSILGFCRVSNSQFGGVPDTMFVWLNTGSRWEICDQNS